MGRLIRPISLKDIPTIVGAFNFIGWNKPASLFEKYLKKLLYCACNFPPMEYSSPHVRDDAAQSASESTKN